MNFLADRKASQTMDRISSENFLIPPLVLMEKASESIRDEILKLPAIRDVLVFAGCGNNGGDAVCCGRMLADEGKNVRIVSVTGGHRESPALKSQLETAKRLGLEIMDFNEFSGNLTDIPPFFKADLIIDGLFGTGLSRPMEGDFLRAVKIINSSAAVKIAVDIPSGISCDTGQVLGCAVRADITVTFGLGKVGLKVYPGIDYAGRITTVKNVFPGKAIETAVRGMSPRIFTFTEDDIKNLFPERRGRKHKGSFGHALVIAGSSKYSGAAFLSASGAYRIGAGLVKVFTHEANRELIADKLPEALLDTYVDKQSALSSLNDNISWADAILIGPGLSQDETAKSLVKEVLKCTDKPVVIDADALNIIAEESLCSLLKANQIMTPHLMEYKRLSGHDMEIIRSHTLEEMMNYTMPPVLVLKDAVTLVRQDDNIYINTTGNSALSKGGSGDVLAGMMLGLLSQGMENFPAASLAVYLHGACADKYVETRESYTMLASEIPEMLKSI
ncbi:MAG: NAD(P)H-hydrate dehydratase [Lachnospiraceae bacterium]|jgi:hydroxyethylthiazole kinase-like uncharacterized protein yjeF|nr:NAD(P)H-hydrate dehydratase [Lachnospiraceae bacterium]MEE3460724.1 NAD(P)H-hydrate dehydratase [Lachnospiraceae bacterium]